MKVAYESDRFKVKAFGVEPMYVVIDKSKHVFIVCENRSAENLRLLLDDFSDKPDIIDIGLDGLIEIAQRYDQAEDCA